MTVYIAGAISKNPNYKADFEKAENDLKAKGFTKIISPTILPSNLEYEQYMTITFAMVQACDCVYMLKNWKDSDGATREYYFAIANKKTVIFED